MFVSKEPTENRSYCFAFVLLRHTSVNAELRVAHVSPWAPPPALLHLLHHSQSQLSHSSLPAPVSGLNWPGSVAKLLQRPPGPSITLQPHVTGTGCDVRKRGRLRASGRAAVWSEGVCLQEETWTGAAGLSGGSHIVEMFKTLLK